MALDEFDVVFDEFVELAKSLLVGQVDGLVGETVPQYPPY